MSTPPSSAPASAANDVTPEPSPVQWADIVQQLGAEIAGPLSAALEQIQNLATTGQIDRRGLRLLRRSVDDARTAGMLGQQLARLASGRLRLNRERQHLTQMLRSVLAQRSRETQVRGVQVRQALKPVEIWADGALLFALLNALMDWALANTHSSVDLRLDLTPWPVKARLSCRFAHRSLDLISAPPSEERQTPGLDSLAWRLLEQTAITLGVLPLREQEAGITLLTLEFNQLAPDEAPPPDSTHARLEAEAERMGGNSRPLAGCQLLILSANRDLRTEAQTAVRQMGMLVDVVGSVAEAEQFCREGLPHAVLFDAALTDDALLQLIASVSREAPDVAFVEMFDAEHRTQLSTATRDGVARISRRNLAEALPSLLMFELSRRN
ncbi:hypothetical protein ACG02S_18245 [Roseateles sp. DC23W]|uniref:Response regulatory domain-containing protein n=1 Tax=Pelomonas dachongensis TaxID=3299029 RepID=A0ABW7ETA8_9BURK